MFKRTAEEMLPWIVQPSEPGHDSVTPLARTTILTAAAVLLLLIVSAVAMQFTEEVNWGKEDFAVAGGLLFCAGMAFPIASRLFRNRTHRAVAIALMLAVVAAVWAHLAVGFSF